MTLTTRSVRLARLLSGDEVDALIERMGGLDEIDRRREQSMRNASALSELSDEYFAAHAGDWIVIYDGDLITAKPSHEEMLQDLEERGIHPSCALIYPIPRRDVHYIFTCD